MFSYTLSRHLLLSLLLEGQLRVSPTPPFGQLCSNQPDLIEQIPFSACCAPVCRREGGRCERMGKLRQ